MAGPDTLRATFFEECEDLLSRLGDGLALMAEPGETSDIETVHGVFRAVHSVKGGAAAFGLTSVVEFAHVFETVLDLMRSGRLPVSLPAMQTLCAPPMCWPIWSPSRGMAGPTRPRWPAC